jgi:tRNA threonylcarbamoyladenosine biosynthesis protein TsaB
MLILAIETATPDVGVALHDGDRPIGHLSLSIGSRHAEAILPGLQHLLDQAGRSVADLTHVAVDRGPGLFTGLRVGVTTARTLAFAQAVPLVGVASLEALAAEHGRTGETAIAVLDARRREVYAGAYRIDETGPVEVVAPLVGPAAEVADQLRAGLEIAATSPGNLVVIGDGAASYPDECKTLGPIVCTARPSAAGLASLAAVQLRSGTALCDPFELLYLRAPDAEITWSNRHTAQP